jgi:hypothetical protein
MKTDPNRYILAAEILVIILIHAVQLKKAEKHIDDDVVSTNISIPAKSIPIDENVFRFEYFLLKSIK